MLSERVDAAFSNSLYIFTLIRLSVSAGVLSFLFLLPESASADLMLASRANDGWLSAGL